MAIINIIMPCYYSDDVIRPALEMIAAQTKVNDIILTMVNDCSPNTNCEYYNLREEFKDKIKIIYLKTPINSGPGVARQIGLDHCACDWVLFHDDDDKFTDKFVIERYLQIIQNNQWKKVKQIIGGVRHIDVDKVVKLISAQDNNSLHGVLFNYNILKQYNIRFHPLLKFDEDSYFYGYVFFKTVLTREEIINFLENDFCVDHYIRNNNYLSLTNSPHISMLEKHIQFFISKVELLKLLLEINNDELFDAFLDLFFFVSIIFQPVIQEFIFNDSSKINQQLVNCFIDNCDFAHSLFLQFNNILNNNEYRKQFINKDLSLEKEFGLMENQNEQDYYLYLKTQFNKKDSVS